MTRLEKRQRAETNARSKLLPCPFCGGGSDHDGPEHKPQILIQEYGYLVVCWDRCGVQLKVFSHILKSVVASWNRRSTPEQRQQKRLKPKV